jgi:hypothetical protein
MTTFFDFVTVAAFISVSCLLFTGLCMIGYAVVSYYRQDNTPPSQEGVEEGCPYVKEKNNFIGAIDSVTHVGWIARFILSELEHKRVEWQLERYSYKGRELCDRLAEHLDAIADPDCEETRLFIDECRCAATEFGIDQQQAMAWSGMMP